MGDRSFNGKSSPALRKSSTDEEKKKHASAKAHREPLDRVSCRAGDNSCASAHASALSRSAGPRIARAEASISDLQRQYGNRFVQRVVAISRQASGVPEVTSDIENAIDSKRGGGHSLDSTVRGSMERAFGADFSDVRIHRDASAADLNNHLSARAFTTGRDIFFNDGAYQPETSSGRELLAHELTHVVQQGAPMVQAKLTVSSPHDPLEQEAERTAARVMRQPEAKKDDEERRKKR